MHIVTCTTWPIERTHVDWSHRLFGWHVLGESCGVYSHIVQHNRNMASRLARRGVVWYGGVWVCYKMCTLNKLGALRVCGV